MAIDIGALRKFEESWRPVLESIPAVIEMSQQRNELEKAVAAKRKEFDDVKAEIQAAYNEADKRLIRINAELDAATADTKAAQAETARLIADRDRELAETGTARKKTLAVTEKKLADTEAALVKVEAEIANKLAAVEVDIKAKTEAAEAALQAIEAKQKAAEAALEAIKAKLG